MNSIRKYEGYTKRESWVTRAVIRMLYGRPAAPVIKPLHVIGYYPPTMPQKQKNKHGCFPQQPRSVTKSGM